MAKALGIGQISFLIKDRSVGKHWLNGFFKGPVSGIPFWLKDAGNGFGSGFTTDFPVLLSLTADEKVEYETSPEDAIRWWDSEYASLTKYPRLYVSGSLRPDGSSTSDTAAGDTPNTAIRSFGTALAKSDGVYGIKITAATAVGTTLTITTETAHNLKVGDVFTATPLVSQTVVMTGIAAAGGTQHTVVSVISDTQFTVTATTSGTYTANSAGICKPRWIIILKQGLTFKYNRTANIGGPWTISSGYTGDICADTIISTDEGIVKSSTQAVSSMEFGDTQSWTREGATDAWHTTFTNTIGSANATTLNVWAMNILDTYGMGRRLVGVTSLAAVQSTANSYWAETTTKLYVNIGSGAVAPTGIEVYRTSNNGFKGNNPYKLFMINVKFKGGTNAFRLGSSHWSNTEYNPKIVMYNCTFEYSNLAGQGFKTEITHKYHHVECVYQYNDADGCNRRRDKAVLIGCIGRWNGYLSTSQTDSTINYMTSASFGTNQGETCHANAQGIIVAGEWYENGGQGIGPTGTLSGASGATGTADSYNVYLGNYIYNSLGITGTGKGRRDIYFGSDAGDRCIMLYTKFASKAGVASNSTTSGNNNVRIEQGILFANSDFKNLELSAGRFVVKGMFERTTSGQSVITY